MKKYPIKKLIPLQVYHKQFESVCGTLYRWTDFTKESKELFPSPNQEVESCNLIYFLADQNRIYVVEDC